jgi:hypothetical protein
MSIVTMISRLCKQDAVYWGNPKNDGYSGFIYDAAVEIKCRWEDKVQLIVDKEGNTQSSRALVYCLQELDEEGWLYLGKLTDLTAAEIANPKLVRDASTIKKFEKSPALNSTTEFYYKAWLTPLLT